MPTYYVDPVNGDNLNNGLGPDASHATNKPWKTIAKLLGSTGMASGDTGYLAPGVYRERVTVAMTSATAETFVYGDPSNAQGFKSSAGVRVSPGPVVHTSFETNDTTLPSAAAATLILSGRDYLTFQFINFIGGGNVSTHCVDGSSATSTNITFRDCAFFGSSHSGVGSSSAIMRAVNASGATGFNWLVERCLFYTPVSGTGITVAPVTLASGADYDVLFVARNCIFLGNYSRSIFFTPSGTATYKPGGLLVDACSLLGTNSTAAINATANSSTTVPVVVRNCCIAGSVGLSATTSGFITSAHNVICCLTRYTNVTAGTGDSTDGAMALAFWLGQESQHNWPLRQAFTPIYGACGLVGFSAGSSPPATDFTNRTRPEGGQSTNITPGALELHNTAVQETSVVDASGSAISITGPGSHDRLFIPVDAVATTITIRVRYDANHGTTNKPRVILMANASIGVAQEIKTATVSEDTWETLTFSAITPTRKGVVQIRCESRAAAGNGVAYFDTLTVT